MIRRIVFVLASVGCSLTAATAASSIPVFAAGNAAGYASQAAYVQTIVGLLNHERAQVGLTPLTLQTRQSLGTSSCVGSVGHSQAMAKTGIIWHINSRQPRASFPNNICVQYRSVGENVGEANTGDETQDLATINNLMMGEPHNRTTCASTINHACNIMNQSFHHVGIGLVYANGTTWLTEDFTN
jgi:uncharacterized protein YkwD